MQNISFLILILMISGCGEDYTEDAKKYQGVCEKKCSAEQKEIICAKAPYIENTLIPYEVMNELNCIFCPGDPLISKKVNDFCSSNLNDNSSTSHAG